MIVLCVFTSAGKKKRATVGPLPGVTQDIAGFKVNFLLLFPSSFDINIWCFFCKGTILEIFLFC